MAGHRLWIRRTEILSPASPNLFLPRFFASLLRKLLIPSNKKAEFNLLLSVWLELGWLDSLTWDIWHQRYIIRNYSFPQFPCNLKTITVSTLKSNASQYSHRRHIILVDFGFRECIENGSKSETLAVDAKQQTPRNVWKLRNENTNLRMPWKLWDKNLESPCMAHWKLWDESMVSKI